MMDANDDKNYNASGNDTTLESSNNSLKGKVAVITGSTQGLGEATAHLFQKRGIHGLIITGRNIERGKNVVKSLCNETTTAYFVQADLANLEDCQKIIQTCDDKFGRLDILVNAAAWTARSTVWDTTPEVWERMMNVNTRAPFFLMQYAVKVMEREHIEGSIVNISSNASYGSMPMLAPYAISKGALNIATKNAAYALMRSRIRVNALAIGWMNTPAEDAVQKQYHSSEKESESPSSPSSSWKAKAEQSLPFGRLLEPLEVAKCIAFCASNDESGMMTGCVIDFDQSVTGGGPAPIPPPKDEWTYAKGVKYSSV